MIKEMRAWRDTSSYSRSAKRSVCQTSSKSNSGELRVILHRHRDYPQTTWLMTCHDINVKNCVLEAADVEKAEFEALLAVHSWLKLRAAECKAMLKETRK